MSSLSNYRRFLARHGQALHTLEAVVQSAAWLAPEGAHTDLALEAASAALGVLGVVNESVAPPQDHAPCRSTLSTCVAIIHQLEVLLEMGAERALGTDDKWAVLACIEALKASLRLAILRRTGGRVLLGDADGSCTGPAPPWVASLGSTSDRASRTLRALAAFRASRTKVAGYPACAPLARVPQAAALPPQLRRARSTLLAGEALRIVRPVVYCLAVRRYGRQSWSPWALALSLDAASDERDELRRRRLLLVYYLLFSPAYEAGIQRGMRRCEQVMAPVPLLGTLTEKMRETLDGVASFHTYTTSL